MYNDQKTAKDRMSKKTKATGIFGKQKALSKKINCKCEGNKCTCK